MSEPTVDSGNAANDDPVGHVLGDHFLFAALEETQRKRLRPHVQIRTFAPGEHLFMQDSPADAFFLLRSGTVKLYRVSAEGQEKVMRVVRPGQTFAEGVMFMDRPHYPVHAEGLERGSVARVDSAAFLQVLRDSFDTCRALMAQATRRIQEHWDEIEALTLQNSRYRMVHYLLELVPTGAHGHVTLELPTYKAVIAAQLGMTPETFSRELRALSDAGLVKVRGRTVDIIDVGRLLRPVGP
ncbi:MAG: Crp/Fnr family transcriptional regulator [Acidiferrobacteraceae bacterium]